MYAASSESIFNKDAWLCYMVIVATLRKNGFWCIVAFGAPDRANKLKFP